MSMIRTATPKAIAVSHRFISSSAKSNAVAASIGHNIVPSSASSSSSSSKAVKVAAIAVVGSTAVVSGLSLLLKDEVVVWTPNARK
ncbi:hypothetical protein BGZ49_008994 [Haplosporangium sp. Z 27]|nr:hypothetical protein BGZ49_008994 [Haplosporangium sp. Z 27]